LSKRLDHGEDRHLGSREKDSDVVRVAGFTPDLTGTEEIREE
jgi:hypothetical protein